MRKWDNNPVEISMDGFQVVSGEMFQHPLRICDSSCTFWYDSISFGKMSVLALKNCENIRIDINKDKRLLLVSPVTENDKDRVRWVSQGKEPQPRRLACRDFTATIYSLWKWDKEYVYRAKGRIVTVEKKVRILFDFKDPESWKYKTKVSANG